MARNKTRVDPRKVATAAQIEQTAAAGVQTGVWLALDTLSQLRAQLVETMSERDVEQGEQVMLLASLDGGMELVKHVYKNAEAKAEKAK